MLNSVGSGPIWPKSELVRDFRHLLITSKYNKNQIRKPRKGGHHFPHYSRSELSVAMETSVLSNLSLYRKQPFLYPNDTMILHIKFDKDWPVGFRDMLVQRCEIVVLQGQLQNE